MAGLYRCTAEPALCYRNSKDYEDRAQTAEGEDLVVPFNAPVRCGDAGDGWLSTYVQGNGTKFLPTKVFGGTVMTPATVLKVISAAYFRHSKDLDAKTSDFCKVGDLLCVEDQGDGWVTAYTANGTMLVPTSVNGETIFGTPDLEDYAAAGVTTMDAPKQNVATAMDSFLDLISVADPDSAPQLERDVGKLRVYLCQADPAICYRHSKSMGDRVQGEDGYDVAVKLNDSVVAVDEGDGWISVDVQGYGIKYLPIKVYGDSCMEKAVVLKAITAVCYRNTKDLSNRSTDMKGEEIICNMDDVIVGVDIGEGWYEVQHAEHGRKLIPGAINGENLFIKTK